MDLTVLLGIISSVIAVIGIIVSSYLIYIDSQEFKTISKGRKKVISGVWKGQLEGFEAFNGNIPTGSIEIILKAKRKVISGKMWLDIAAGELGRSDLILLKGGFKMDRFLELNFHNAKDEIVQFGNLIVELDSMGNKLEGKLHGYGPQSRRIMSGKIQLTKES